MKAEILLATQRAMKEYYSDPQLMNDITVEQHIADCISGLVEKLVMPKIAEVKRSKTLGTWESIRERFVCPKCETEEITDSCSYCPNCGIKINFIE